MWSPWKVLAVAAFLLPSVVPVTMGSHEPCAPYTVEGATEVGPFYVVGQLRYFYEETNGVPGLQLWVYPCAGHAEAFPSDTCYLNRDVLGSTWCASTVTARWLP